mgnify:FL=1
MLVGVNEAPGWGATVDGEPVRILRANHSHMAGPVSRSGTVELRFRPPGLIAGAAISVLALIVCAGLVLIGRSSGRRQPTDRPAERL